MSSILENKDVRSALIALVSAGLTWATDAVAAWSGTSLGVYAPAVMAAWAVAVNAVQTRVRQFLKDAADDAAGAELQRGIEERRTETPEPPRLKTLRDLADDGSAPRVVLLLAAILSLSAVASAAPPRAIITGPNTGTPGEFLTLDASTSEGDPKHFRWSINPELRGRKQLLPTLTGERCTIASFPGRYVVTLAVANEDGIDSLTWQIEIPGNAPCQPPEPQPITPQPVVPVGPTPIPQPVNPVTPQPVGPPAAGEFGIAVSVYEAARAASSPSRAQDCQRLAAECRRLGTMPADSINAIAAEMVRVLVTLPSGWDALKTKVKTTVATLAGTGRVKTAADLQRLLLELADAFERAGR